MSKDREFMAKMTVGDEGTPVGRGIEDAASGLRKKGIEIQDYLKKVKAEVEEWKFGVEESKDGFRVEWRVVALLRKPKEHHN